MPKRDIATIEAETLSQKLQQVLSDAEVEKVARRCGFLRRRREIAPAALLVACISALGAGTAAWLADILRAFNAFTGKAVRYKPFHNQLSKRRFPIFIHAILEQALAKLTTPVLESLPKGKLAQFSEILCHDGTSFALKGTLARKWPGRFTKVTPAAVELHVTMSVLRDNPVAITLAPDKESERPFAPKAASLNNRLILEDRGFEDRVVFADTREAGGFFIVRGKKNSRPIIRSARDENGRRPSSRGQATQVACTASSYGRPRHRVEDQRPQDLQWSSRCHLHRRKTQQEELHLSAHESVESDLHRSRSRQGLQTQMAD